MNPNHPGEPPVGDESGSVNNARAMNRTVVSGALNIRSVLDSFAPIGSDERHIRDAEIELWESGRVRRGIARITTRRLTVMNRQFFIWYRDREIPLSAIRELTPVTVTSGALAVRVRFGEAADDLMDFSAVGRRDLAGETQALFQTLAVAVSQQRAVESDQ